MGERELESEREHVDVVGPPDAPPVVLVHGTVFNRTMWGPQREALSDEFRVIAPDLPGHGDRRDERFRLAAGIETVERVVDRLADDPVRLVGLSLGGYVATAYAHRNPERVERLVVADSCANPTGVLSVLSRLVGGTALLASKSDTVERGVDRLASWWVRNRDIAPELKAEIVDAGFDLEPFGRAGFEIAGQDFRAMFGAYDGPALVVNGQWDLLMRRGEAAHAAAAKDAKVTVIRGAGHACNLEEPTAFTTVLRGFIAVEQ